MTFFLIQVSGYVGLEYFSSVKDAKEHALENAREKVTERQEVFKKFLASKKVMLHAISDSREFQNFLNGTDHRLDRLFLVLASADTTVMQLRYLDKNGLERLRVERETENGEPFVNTYLQDKSGRYYFRDVINMEPGRVHFSALDLNIEHGVVQQPSVPTIRAMLPLEKDGSFDGVLVVNLFVRSFLRQWVNTPNYDSIVCDSDGHPMTHFDANKSWGAYLNPPYSIQTELPNLFESIRTQPEFRNKTLYSKHLDLPIQNRLIYILKLKQSYLAEMKEACVARMLSTLFVMFLIALLTTYVISKIILKFLNDLHRQRELAEVSKRAKAQFLANMSHEIRTPLNSILGFAEILSKGETNAERLRLFEIIKKSGSSLQVILNDILDYSKIEYGKLVLEERPVEVSALFEQVIDLYGKSMEEKSIHFEKRFSVDLPGCILIDEVRFRQVLSNLFSNAVKFTPENGAISLEVRYDSAARTLHCSVTDTGIGIARENLKKIFNAYDQETNSVTRKFGGTGLGLPIASQIVGQMGGKLDVESHPGKGSRFYFDIPVRFCDAQGAIDADDAARKEVDNFRYVHHVLIVDDLETNRLLLSMILDELGATYDVAGDGEAALRLYETTEYSIIFMDQYMPNMGGIETSKRIRKVEEQDGRARTPIVMMTADVMIKERSYLNEAVPDDYIIKPYPKDEVVRVLKQHPKL